MALPTIRYDGLDITSTVIFRDAIFATQVNGRPGECQFRIRDETLALAMTTGKPITLDVGGVRVWTGYLAKVRRVYAFPAFSTPNARLFQVEGVDINILFLRRYVFKQSDPAHFEGPTYTGVTSDTTALTELLSNWLDLSGDGLDTSTLVDHVGNINLDQPAMPWWGAFTWGQAMTEIAKIEGAIFYIDPQKRLVYTDVDTPNAPFGVSDRPTAGQVGFREGEILFDGGGLINDFLGWGISGAAPQPIFKRVEDSASIAAHGLWQFGGIYAGVWKQPTLDKIANTSVYGSPNNKRGAKDDRVAIEVVVLEPGFVAGQKVAFESEAFGYSDVIPIRRMEIRFPTSTDAFFKLLLSHEIDELGFMDPWPPFRWGPPPFFDFTIPPFGGIPPITIPPIPVPPGGQGGCDPADCGITDTWTRVVAAPEWGRSDSNLVWEIAHGGPAGGYAYANGVIGSLVAYEAPAGSDTNRASATLTPPSPLTNIVASVEFTPNVDSGASLEVGNEYVLASLGFGGPSLVTAAASVRIHNTGLGIECRLDLNKSLPLGTVDHFVIPSIVIGVKYHLEITAAPGQPVSGRVYADGTTPPAYSTMSSSLSSTATFTSVSLAVSSPGGHSTGSVRVETFFDNLSVEGLDRCALYGFDLFDRTANPGLGISTAGYTWANTLGQGDFAHGDSVGSIVSNGFANIFAFHGTGTSSLNPAIEYTVQSQSSAPYNASKWTMEAQVRAIGRGEFTFAVLTSGGGPTRFFKVHYDPTDAIGYAVRVTPVNGPDEWVPFAWDQSAIFKIKWDYADLSYERVKIWLASDPEPDAWTAVGGTQFNSLVGVPLDFMVGNAHTLSAPNSNSALQIDYITFESALSPCYKVCTDTVIPAGESCVTDDFNRTVSGNWGTGPLGAWTNSGSDPTTFGVNGSRATAQPTSSVGTIMQQVVTNPPIAAASEWIIRMRFKWPSSILVTDPIIFEIDVMDASDPNGDNKALFCFVTHNQSAPATMQASWYTASGSSQAAATVPTPTADLMATMEVGWDRVNGFARLTYTPDGGSPVTRTTPAGGFPASVAPNPIVMARMYNTRAQEMQIEYFQICVASSGSTSTDCSDVLPAPGGEPQVTPGSDVCENFTADGFTQDFTVKAGYMAGTLVISDNGEIKERGTDWVETSTVGGQFHLNYTPSLGHIIRACYYATTNTGGVSGGGSITRVI